MLICFGVFETWSRPRMTCVIPSSQSSTGDAKLYVGRPSERTSTRSSSTSFGISTWPRTRSSYAVVALVGHAKADRALVLVRVAGLDEALRLLLAALHAVELEAERVPVEAEPGERALDLLGRALDLAVHVGVLDPQQALAALLAREQPVEEERTRGADVEEAGRRRRHANPHGRAGMSRTVPGQYRSRVFFGAHVSASGGIHTTLDRAEAMRADAVQLFTQSPRMWRPTNHDPANFEAFKGRTRRSSASRRAACSRTRSISSTSPRRTEEIHDEVAAPRCGTRWRSRCAIDADGVVFHVGSHLGAGIEAGMKRCVPAIKEALELCTDTTWLLLEDSAGAGGTIGRSIDELARSSTRATDTSASASASTRATSTSPASTSPNRDVVDELLEERRRDASASTGCARCTSTTRATRSARTATGTRTSARA